MPHAPISDARLFYRDIIMQFEEIGTMPGAPLRARRSSYRCCPNAAPCVLLMDELVSYFRQFQEGLTSGDDHFWFDVRPNLRREMEERKRRFENRANEVNPEIRARMAFDQIHDEIIKLFLTKPSVTVTVRLAINAQFSESFDENLQRAALDFNDAEFD